MSAQIMGILSALVALILLTSVFPFALRNSWSEIILALRGSASLAIHEPVLVTILERLITFLPLGFLAHRGLARRGVSHPKLLASCSIAIFAFAIEAAQMLVAERHARLSDLLLAMACGATGILLSAWSGERPVAPAKGRALLLALLVLGNAALTFVVVDAHLGKAIEGWDCSYPLIVANEGANGGKREPS